MNKLWLIIMLLLLYAPVHLTQIIIWESQHIRWIVDVSSYPQWWFIFEITFIWVTWVAVIIIVWRLLKKSDIKWYKGEEITK